MATLDKRQKDLKNRLKYLDDVNKSIEKLTNKLSELKARRNAVPDKLDAADNEIHRERALFEISRVEERIEKMYKVKAGIEIQIEHIKENVRKEKEIEAIREKNKVENYPKYILNTLINKSRGKNYLTYDELYESVPAHVVSADMTDEITRLLKENNVKVIDKEERIERYLDKVDNEFMQYERDIEVQLNELLKGSYEKKTSDKHVPEALDIRNIIEKPEIEPERFDINIPPQLPKLVDVTPTLTNDSDFLLISKVKSLGKKSASLVHIENINPVSLDLDNLEPHFEENGELLPYRGPKIFSKARFDNDRRLSLYAKTVGDRAEEIVIKFLNETLPPNEKKTIRWISKAGETPGWDIAYFNEVNQIIAIEVKGTTGSSFPNIEITANEWNAANNLQERYWIYLVTSCFGRNPQIQRISNPAKLNESGILRVTPILWKIEMMITKSTDNDQ